LRTGDIAVVVVVGVAVVVAVAVVVGATVVVVVVVVVGAAVVVVVGAAVVVAVVVGAAVVVAVGVSEMTAPLPDCARSRSDAHHGGSSNPLTSSKALERNPARGPGRNPMERPMTKYLATDSCGFDVVTGFKDQNHIICPNQTTAESVADALEFRGMYKEVIDAIEMHRGDLGKSAVFSWLTGREKASRITFNEACDLLSTVIGEVNTVDKMETFDLLVEAHSDMLNEQLPTGDAYTAAVQVVPEIADIEGIEA
jgi:hypothetical protein